MHNIHERYLEEDAQIEVKAAEGKVLVTLPIDDPEAELPLALLVPEEDDGEVYAKPMERLNPFFAEAVFEGVKDGGYWVVIQSSNVATDSSGKSTHLASGGHL